MMREQRAGGDEREGADEKGDRRRRGVEVAGAQKGEGLVEDRVDPLNARALAEAQKFLKE